MDWSGEEIKKRLRQGDYLEVSTGGGIFEVWAEPFGSPPALYYEGEQFSLDHLDGIVEKIMTNVRSGEIRCRWVDKRDD